MAEPNETSTEVQKTSDPQPAAVSEPAKPPAATVEAAAPALPAAKPAVAEPESRPTRHAAPARSTDTRSEHRRANVKKARAGHRRNIRRSNTNG